MKRLLRSGAAQFEYDLVQLSLYVFVIQVGTTRLIFHHPYHHLVWSVEGTLCFSGHQWSVDGLGFISPRDDIWAPSDQLLVILWPCCDTIRSRWAHYISRQLVSRLPVFSCESLHTLNVRADFAKLVLAECRNLSLGRKGSSTN
jgi:hypothetical protein